MKNIRLIKHEAIPDCGSYEVRFPDGRPSRFYYDPRGSTIGTMWPVADYDQRC